MPNSDTNIHDVSGRVAVAPVAGNLTGDIIAGDKHVVQYITEQKILRQTAPQMAAAPYKFLASYEISDRDIFFGRDAVIEELLGLIPRHKTLIINGRSGAGKTSLLHAGLIPRLAESGYQYISFRDYTDPLRQLREHVAQNDLFKPYADQAHSLPLLLKALSHQQPVALIFDQFERFFVNVPAALRAQFIQEVNACLNSDLSSTAAHLLFALREDFFGALVSEFEALIPTFLNDAARLNLRPLRKDEAREAILQPIKHLPTRIGYDLPFVDDVLLPGLMNAGRAGQELIDPPHVQIVCNQLYQAARDRYAAELKQGGMAQIDRRLYEALGETRGILRTYLDDVLERAAYNDPTRRDVLRSMLKVMVESTGTRKFVALPDLRQGLPDVPASDLERYVQQLQTSRVLETRGSGTDTQYSLSHEVLVEKVQNWCDERELQRKKAQETLARGLAEWQSTQALLNAKQVAHIRQWIGAEQLDEQAEQLLTASQQAYEEQRRKEARQERLIKFGTRIIVGLVALALMIAVGLTVWALRERKTAEHQARVALIRSIVASALQANFQDKREHAALLAKHAALLNERYNGNVQAEIDAALRTIFRTESITEEPYSPVLVEQVCQKVKLKIALTPEEWTQLVGAEIPYQPACPELEKTQPLSLRSKKMITTDAAALALNLRNSGKDLAYPTHYVENQFEDQGEVVFDRATGLMWQKSGSKDSIGYAAAQEYVENLNDTQFAGYNDWRLPTVEELLSLMELEKQSNDLHINPLFDANQTWMWSADIYQIKDESSAESAWLVYFNVGLVGWNGFDNANYVRGVRS